MRIYDCFMYFDEEIVLETRFEYLNKYVDYFVIIESRFTHKGDKRNLKFNLNNFSKFKHKIIYKVHDEVPNKIEKVLDGDDEVTKTRKYIMNALYRENAQRNYINEGIKNAEDEDIILISDVDEIPNLSKISFKEIKEKIILFKQEMFYYKFNLRLPRTEWVGTKGCKKKYLKNPQWLRNIKDRKYSFFRIDTFFSENKYIDVKIINDGGWHFSQLKKIDDIYSKLTNSEDHQEFKETGKSMSDIEDLVKRKVILYDHKAKSSEFKFGTEFKLQTVGLANMPKYIQKNKEQFKEWIDVE